MFLSVRISQKQNDRTSPNFMRVELTVTVARSFFGGVEVC